MKTLKLTLCFVALLAFTQGKAQTKEETIKWLTEKLSKNLYCGSAKISVVVINECEMIFSSFDEPTKWTEGKVYRITVPTAVISLGRNGQFEYNYDAVKVEDGMTKTTYKRNTTDNYLYIQQGEENLKQRIEKALTHLATFCEKKKEAF